MTDAWAELSKPDVADPARNPPSRGPEDDSKSTIITGTVSAWNELTRPEFRATDKPPGRGIIERKELVAPNLLIARASLAPDVKDQIRTYSQHFGVPENHFGVVEGEIVRWVPEENAFAKVVPTIGGASGVGGTARGVLGQAAEGFGPSLPGAAATITGAAAGPTALSILIAGGTAFLADWARQAVDKALRGDELVPFGQGDTYDYWNMGGHAGLAMGAQAIGVGVNRLLTNNPMGVEAYDRIKAMDALEKAKWEAIEQEAASRNVTLSVGQRTGLQSLMQKERQLSRYGETADHMQKFRDDQRLGQIPTAYYDEISKVAPIMGREDMISSFRAGAGRVVDAAQAARDAEAEVAYGAARAAFPSLDSPFLRSLWDREAFREAMSIARKVANTEGEKLGPVDMELTQLARELSAAGKLEAPTGGVASGLSLQTWDRVKRILYDMAQEHYDETAGKYTTQGNAINKLRVDLTKELDSLTGGPQGLYAQARSKYGDSSELVEAVLEGGVGYIKSLKGLDKVQMVKNIFSGKNVLPEEIARTRDLFKQAGEEQTWRNGIAIHLAEILDDSLKGAGMTGNVPGQLYTRLSRDRLQRDAIEAALGQAHGKSFYNFVDKVLFPASRSLPEGSPTITDAAANENVVGKGVKVLGFVLSPGDWFRVGNVVVDGYKELRKPEARIKLAQYLTSDQGRDALKQFSMPSRLTQKSIVAMSEIFSNAGVIGAGGRTPSDFEAPIAAQMRGQK